MGNDWLHTTIGDVCQLGDGAHAKVERIASGIPYLTSKNIGEGSLKLDSIDYISQTDYDRLFPKNSKAVTRLNTGDILTGIIGTFGNIYQYKEGDHFGISNAIAILRPDPKRLLPKYFYYFLNSSYFRQMHEAYAAGSVQGYTNLPTIRQLPAIIPPLPEQKSIAHILGSLDDKIELNRQINATLEGMAQALFKSWFVDFDPVIDNALAAGNPIPEAFAARTETRRKALADGTANRDVAKQFPAAFQFTEEIGWIPEVWKVTNLKKIAQNIRISVDPHTLPEATPYVGLEHIDKHTFSLSRWGYARDIDSQKSQFEKGDFLFGKLRPYFHKVCQVQTIGICSTDILVIRPKDHIYSGFIGCQIFEPKFVEYANLRSTGTRMPRASWKDMSDYEISVPDNQLIEYFNKITHATRHKCNKNIQKNQILSNLRDTLLPKLISGEIRIPEAEKLTEEALA